MEITNNTNEPIEVRVPDLDPNCLECLAERLREIADRVSYCAKLEGDLTSLVQVADGDRPRYATAKAILGFLDGSDAIRDEVTQHTRTSNEEIAKRLDRLEAMCGTSSTAVIPRQIDRLRDVTRVMAGLVRLLQHGDQGRHRDAFESLEELSSRL